MEAEGDSTRGGAPYPGAVTLSASPEETEQIQALREGLLPYTRASGDFRNSCLGVAAPGSASAAMRRLGFPAGEQGPGLRAWAAESNLMGFAILLSAEAIPNFAPQAVLRGALEGDAWALWLLDPSLSPKKRAARWLTARLENVNSYRRYKIPEALSHADERTEEIVREATRLGLQPTVDEKTGSVVAIGKRPPTKSDLVAQLLPDLNETSLGIEMGRLVYLYLSGYSHAELSAVLMGRRPLGPPGESSQPTLLPMGLGLVLLVFRCVLLLHDRMLTKTAQFEG